MTETKLTNTLVNDCVRSSGPNAYTESSGSRAAFALPRLGFYVSGDYYLYEAFTRFDASSTPIPAGDTITNAVIRIYIASDNTSTRDIILEARIRDVGATVTVDDWTITNISAMTLVATLDTTGLSPGWWEFTPEEAFYENISKDGITPIMILAKVITDNDFNIAEDYLHYADGDGTPIELVITHSEIETVVAPVLTGAIIDNQILIEWIV